MKLSAMASQLKPSLISDVFDLAVKLRQEGRDLVDFCVGEPDFDTPKAISEAGRQAILDGYTRYTSVDGTAEMKDAVIRKFKRENGLEFSREEVVVGSGAKPVIATAIASVVGEGDEVLLPTPCWPSHLGMIEVAGALAKRVECEAEDGFKLSANALAKAITPKTRLLILCSPSNPTGAVYSRGELEKLAEVLRDRPDVLILSDDLYEHILYDGVEFATIAAIAPELRERVLTVSGVSKAYAMTGWRIGYAAGAKPWARAIAGLFSHINGSPCAISQQAAIAALDGDQVFLKNWQNIYQKRRDILLEELAKTAKIKAIKPAGAFYVFVDISPALGMNTPSGHRLETSGDFARYLVEEGVVVTPGLAFEAEGFIRISIATSETEIEKGAKRIVKAVEKLNAA